MKKLAALVFVVGVVAATFVAGAGPAGAAEVTGPPDSSGYWAYCDIGTTLPFGDTTPGIIDVSCQYGPTNVTIASGDLRLIANGQTFGTGTLPASGSGGAFAVSENANGRYHASRYYASGGNPGGGHFPITGGFVYSLTLERGTTDQVVGNSAACSTACSVPSDIASTFHSNQAYSTMPANYWPGGHAGPNVQDTGDFVSNGDIDGGDQHTATQEDCGSWIHIACHFRNALRAVFVPTTLETQLEDVQDESEDQFPLNVVTEVTTAVADLGTSFSSALVDAQGYCDWNITGSSGGDLVLPILGTHLFGLSLPIDGPGCSTPSGIYGTILGSSFITLFRTLMLILLLIGFAQRVIRAFTSGKPDDLEPGMEA